MNRIVLVVFFLAAMVALLLQCGRSSKPNAVADSNETHRLIKGFNALSRKEQVLECARCHPAEYHNEQIGPHANSYKMMTKFANYVHQPSYESKFYTHYLDGVVEKSCINCHAADNLYQTFFPAYLTNPDSLIASWKTYKITLPESRADKQSRATGVDCITCHYNGQSVVTNASFKITPGASPPFCSPKASVIFSSDYNCIACHFSKMTSDHSLYLQGQPKGMSCVGCHQEYDAKGKGTHYYYWSHDPDNKPKPTKLASFYNPLRVTRKANKVTACWSNLFMPHQMGDASEWILEFKVIDKNQKEWAGNKVRLNCKQFHDTDMKADFGEETLPGVYGINPVYNSPPIVTELTLPPGAPQKNLTLVCNGYHKTQYWLSDSIRILEHTSSLAIP